MRLLESYWVACYRLSMLAIVGTIGAAAFMATPVLALLVAYPLAVLLLVTWQPRP